MNPTKSTPGDFGAKFQQLEAIANWFESDNMDLDDGLAKFEQGLTLVADLRKYLETAQNKVEKIRAKFEASPSGSVEEEEPAPDPATASESADLSLFAD